MSWNKLQISRHKKAAEKLGKIIKKIIEFIKRNPETTDVEIRQFIGRQYKKYHLVSDKQKSIVAFGKNTSLVHYFAEQPSKLKNGDLIMIDIWARLDKNGAPFADITWMLYYGRKLPEQYADAFNLVAQARDKAVSFIRNNLKKKIAPTGKEVDAAARNYLAKNGWGDKFLHGTGHSLGFSSPHGVRTRINRKSRRPLPLNIGYTIEPGIYFKNKSIHSIDKNKNCSKRINSNIECGGEFGIRGEIDFYIDENYKLIITSKIQKKIINI